MQTTTHLCRENLVQVIMELALLSSKQPVKKMLVNISLKGQTVF